MRAYQFLSKFELDLQYVEYNARLRRLKVRRMSYDLGFLFDLNSNIANGSRKQRRLFL